jgi:hypothetical protein
MSIKSKVFAAAATLTLVGGTAAAGALSAGAATPSCGSNCLDVFSKQFGTFHHPGFVLDVFRQGVRKGQPIILFRTSNSDPAEDFTVGGPIGTTSDFYAAGLVSSAIELHYGGAKTAQNPAGNPAFPDDPAFELEYAPFGADSGMCVGLAQTAFQGEKVSLQPCGVSAKTVWILDVPLRALQQQQSDGCPLNPLYFLEAPVINGSDTNFSHPFVLTYPANGFPTDSPRPQLQVRNLTGFSQTGLPGNVCGTNSIAGPDSSQEWAAVTGALTH